MKQPAVYMLANRKNGTPYTGVTSNLVARLWQHRNATMPGFGNTYGCNLLVWFELHDTMASAISREKQIKGGSRAAKGVLIAASNPDWLDLYDTLF